MFTRSRDFFDSEGGAWVEMCVAEILVFIHVSDSDFVGG